MKADASPFAAVSYAFPPRGEAPSRVAGDASLELQESVPLQRQAAAGAAVGQHHRLDRSYQFVLTFVRWRRSWAGLPAVADTTSFRIALRVRVMDCIALHEPRPQAGELLSPARSYVCDRVTCFFGSEASHISTCIDCWIFILPFFNFEFSNILLLIWGYFIFLISLPLKLLPCSVL